MLQLEGAGTLQLEGDGALDLEALAVRGAGQIASGQAVGSPTVTLSVIGAGVFAAQAVGNPAVELRLVAQSVAPLVVVVGEPGIAAVVQALAASSAEAIGALELQASVAAAGIDDQAAGSPAVQPQVEASGIESVEAIGALAVFVPPPAQSSENIAGGFASVPPPWMFDRKIVGAGGIASSERFGACVVAIDARSRGRKVREEEWLLLKAA